MERQKRADRCLYAAELPGETRKLQVFSVCVRPNWIYRVSSAVSHFFNGLHTHKHTFDILEAVFVSALFHLTHVHSFKKGCTGPRGQKCLSKKKKKKKVIKYYIYFHFLVVLIITSKKYN